MLPRKRLDAASAELRGPKSPPIAFQLVQPDLDWLWRIAQVKLNALLPRLHEGAKRTGKVSSSLDR